MMDLETFNEKFQNTLVSLLMLLSVGMMIGIAWVLFIDPGTLVQGSTSDDDGPPTSAQVTELGELSGVGSVR